MERVPHAPHQPSGSGVERCTGGRLGPVLRGAAAGAERAFTAALESALTAVLLYLLHLLHCL